MKHGSYDKSKEIHMLERERYDVRKRIKKIEIKRLNKTFVIYKMSELNYPTLGYITKEWYNTEYFECFGEDELITKLFELTIPHGSKPVIDLIEELATIYIDGMKIEEVASIIEKLFNKHLTTPKDKTFRDNVYYVICYLTLLFWTLDRRIVEGNLTKVGRRYIVDATLQTMRGDIPKEEAKLIFRKENMFGIENGDNDEEGVNEQKMIDDYWL